MNLISPVKNTQQIAILCPQRGLCQCMGAGSLQWFTPHAKQSGFAKESKSLAYALTKCNTWSLESSY